MGRVQYDAFSEIYDIWAATAHLSDIPFFIDAYLAAQGPVVEVGIGDGRVAIEVARRGGRVIGVDSSERMLERCRRRAEAAGAASMLELIQADMEEFTLSEPAALITIPFRSFLHKISMEDKLRTLRHLHEQLRPGGRLIFDAFVYNPESAQRFGSPHLRAEYRDEKTHRDVLLWAATRYDEDQQAIRIVSWTDELDREGVVVRRKYRRLDFSWLDPEQARSLLLDAGFEVEAVYQDYEKTPFAPGAGLHIWVARKPGEGSNPAASGA